MYLHLIIKENNRGKKLKNFAAPKNLLPLQQQTI